MTTTNGDLASCPANAFHNDSYCKLCTEQSDYTLNNILGNKIIDLRLSLETIQVSIKEILSLNELVEYELYNVPFGALVASQLVDDYKDCFLSLKDIQHRVSELLINAISLYKTCRRTIKDNNIEKVYVWNGRRPSDGPVCYAAYDENVSFEVYISGGKKGTYFTLPAFTIHDLAENKKLMNSLYTESVRKTGIKEAEKEAEVFYKNCRHGGGDFPGYIHFAKNNTLGTEAGNGARRKIVIFTSSYYEYFGRSDFVGGCYSSHYEGIKKIANDTNITSQYDLIIRWHPNLKNCGKHERNIINNIIGTSYKNTVQYAPESTIDSYGLIDIANIVITFGSTIGIEANYYDKPSILLGKSIYEDAGSCYTPVNHEELVELLNTSVLPLPKTGAIKYGHYARNYGQNKYLYLIQIDSNNFMYKNKSLLKIKVRTRIKEFIKSVKHRISYRIGLL